MFWFYRMHIASSAHTRKMIQSVAIFCHTLDSFQTAYVPSHIFGISCLHWMGSLLFVVFLELNDGFCL